MIIYYYINIGVTINYSYYKKLRRSNHDTTRKATTRKARNRYQN